MLNICHSEAWRFANIFLHLQDAVISSFFIALSGIVPLSSRNGKLQKFLKNSITKFTRLAFRERWSN